MKVALFKFYLTNFNEFWNSNRQNVGDENGLIYKAKIKKLLVE
jgi:hypothetical protein